MRVGNRLPGLSTLTVAIFLTGSALPAPAALIVKVTTDSPLKVTVTGTSTDEIVADKAISYNFLSPSRYWAFNFVVTLTEGTTFDPDDKISVAGTVQHRLSPPKHDDGNGDFLKIDLRVDADNATGSPPSVSDSDDVKKSHGTVQHEDHYLGDLTAQVKTTNIVVDTILSYEFNLTVTHCGGSSLRIQAAVDSCPFPPPLTTPYEVQPVPEPSSIALVGLGLAGVAFVGGKRYFCP